MLALKTDEASDALAADDGNEPLTGRYRDSRREVAIRNQLSLTGYHGDHCHGKGGTDLESIHGLLSGRSRSQRYSWSI